MHLTWLGLSAVKLEAKEVTIVADPYAPGAASRPLRAKADLVTVSDIQSELGNHVSAISGAPFPITTPGEFEIKGVYVHGVEGSRVTSFVFELEGLRVAHLGLVSAVPADAVLEKLDGVDVLCVPVGGGAVLDAAGALKVVNALEPSVVVPVLHAAEGLKAAIKLAPVAPFLKELGASGVQPVERALIKKRDLSEEETTVLLLKP